MLDKTEALDAVRVAVGALDTGSASPFGGGAQPSLHPHDAMIRAHTAAHGGCPGERGEGRSQRGEESGHQEGFTFHRPVWDPAPVFLLSKSILMLIVLKTTC